MSLKGYFEGNYQRLFVGFYWFGNEAVQNNINQ